jgi:D-3-phosphoglycerate dehydrogenase
MMLNVLVTDNLATTGLDILQQVDNIHVEVLPTLPTAELQQQIGKYHAIIIRSATQLSAEILQHAKKLELIIRAGIGVDNIDQQAATQLGILVANTPHSNSTTTAEHTFSLISALSRKIVAACTSLKQQQWEKKKFLGLELRGKILGLIGMGNIGSIVARIATGYQMNIVTYDPFISTQHAQSLGVTKVTLDELLESADIVSLHCPRTEKTQHIIDAQALQKMKPSALLINCARGGLVNEEDLLRALREESIAGAALDVFVKEPPGDHPLLALDNVIATPHLGASTKEAQESVSRDACQLLLEFAKYRIVNSALNLPIKLKGESLAKSAYFSLAEKLGSMQGQLVNGVPHRIVVECYGEETSDITELVELIVAKSILRNIFSEGNINYVNVPMFAKQRDIDLVSSHLDASNDELAKTYRNLIRVRFFCKTHQDQISEQIIAGTVIGLNHLRILQFNQYLLDFRPAGSVIMMLNEDKPGVVGQVGTLLAQENINIACLSVNLPKNEKHALAFYSLATQPQQNILKQILEIKPIQACYLLHFTA